MKKFLISLFLIICVIYLNSKSTFALESNFTYLARIYKPFDEIEINFPILECFNFIKVKPNSSSKVEIYNPDTKKWVGPVSSWEDFPFLSEKMKIRVAENNSQKISASFTFQNIKFGKVYSSDSFNLWISFVYTDYIQRLNDSINLN